MSTWRMVPHPVEIIKFVMRNGVAVQVWRPILCVAKAIINVIGLGVLGALQGSII